MLKNIIALYHASLRAARPLSDIVLLGMRLWIADIFWTSGALKFNDWETTLYLFTDEHPVPFLPPEIAAYSGTFFELSCSLALAFGLASRLACLPLLAMTAVIQFTYMHNQEHLYWALILANILSIGPGRISLDYFIKRHFIK